MPASADRRAHVAYDRAMSDASTPTIRPAAPADAGALAELWLRSWAVALPTVTRAHPDDDVRAYVRDVLLPEHPTWVLTQEQGDLETVVGFLVLGDGWIKQLYLEPDYIGRQLGDHLMRLAKAEYPSGLQLWTFAVNAAARRFYARHGFVEVEQTDGAGNEEREPDVRLVWHPQT